MLLQTGNEILKSLYNKQIVHSNNAYISIKMNKMMTTTKSYFECNKIISFYTTCVYYNLEVLLKFALKHDKTYDLSKSEKCSK